MAIRALVMFPDPRLRQPAAPVATFGDALKDLADDVVDTMRAANGIGLTAPHIGVAARLVAIEPDATAGVRLYINPRVTWASATLVRHQEGSVSMPGVADLVERPDRVRVRYQDLDGRDDEVEADGLAAVCLQHEIDQLDGLFWIYRLSRLKRDRLVRRYEKHRDAPPTDG